MSENNEQSSGSPLASPTYSAIFEYRGAMYMRPCDRGVILCDLPDEPQFDNDVLPDGDYYVEIRVFPSQNIKDGARD